MWSGRAGSSVFTGFATPLPQADTDIRTVRELLGHGDVSTNMIDTQMRKIAAGDTAGPLDTQTRGLDAPHESPLAFPPADAKLQASTPPRTQALREVKARHAPDA